MTKPKLIMFSPLPPMQTGIADYTYELLTGLAAARDCIVVCEDGSNDLRAPEGATWIGLSEYWHRQGEFADRLHVYHIGNNPDHVYMLPILTERPGIVVLHDPNLHHLFDCATAARGAFAAYGAALAAECGGPGRVLSQQFLQHRLREPAMTRDMPMLSGIVGPARGVVVHSRFAAVKVRARVPHAAVTMVPHHALAPSAPPRPRAQVRAELGIGAEEVVFLSLGFVTHTKCLDRALNALTLVAERGPAFRYIVAGESRPAEPDVAVMAERMGLADYVITTGFVSEARFYDLLGAADVVINLRHPVGGETSGTLIRALGRGACCVVVDRGPFAEIPDGAAVKIPWGVDFNGLLGAVLLRLAQEPELRAHIGAAGARWIAAEHRLEASVAGYLRAIRAAEARRAVTWRTRATWSFAPAAAKRPNEGKLWQRVGALPVCEPERDALCVASAPDAATGWTWHLCRLDALPTAGLAFDLALIEAESADFVAGEASLLLRLNEMLRFGGMLVLNLTRCVDGPRGMLETQAGGTQLLEARGFTVQLHATGPEPDLIDPHLIDPNGHALVEEHCWRVVKTGDFMARPQWRDA